MHMGAEGAQNNQKESAKGEGEKRDERAYRRCRQEVGPSWCRSYDQGHSPAVCRDVVRGGDHGDEPAVSLESCSSKIALTFDRDSKTTSHIYTSRAILPTYSSELV